MHYRCNKCQYEFDVTIMPHPHQGLNFLSVGVIGCPVCAKAAAKGKVCPKCQSEDLTQTIIIKKGE